ncbi:hypothetical protein HanIR_Chr04g0206391 [Helianthus annuus]|nr:hypothetical protein HanIR_Chr04g0206391 [Helianthus annuus]
MAAYVSIQMLKIRYFLDLGLMFGESFSYQLIYKQPIASWRSRLSANRRRWRPSSWRRSWGTTIRRRSWLATVGWRWRPTSSWSVWRRRCRLAAIRWSWLPSSWSRSWLTVIRRRSRLLSAIRWRWWPVSWFTAIRRRRLAAIRWSWLPSSWSRSRLTTIRRRSRLLSAIRWRWRWRWWPASWLTATRRRRLTIIGRRWFSCAWWRSRLSTFGWSRLLTSRRSWVLIFRTTLRVTKAHVFGFTFVTRSMFRTLPFNAPLVTLHFIFAFSIPGLTRLFT